MLKINKCIIFIIFSTLLIKKINAQFVLSPIKNTATFIKKDSILNITYYNDNETEVLIWVGDFVIDYLWQTNQYCYLPTPIKNEIYLFEDQISSFLNAGKHSKNDNILKQKNYKLLQPKEVFTISILLKDDNILKKIKKCKVYLRYCIVDIINLCISQNKANSLPCNINSEKAYFPADTLFVSSIKWSNNGANVYKQKNDLPIKVKNKIPVSLIKIPNLQSSNIADTVNELLNFQKSYQTILKIKNK